jgi:SAM-dependent methyltransferase
VTVPPVASALAPASRVTTIETIEILGVDLLDQHRALVEDLRRQARSLGLEFGWHYLLDLTWIISRLGPVSGKRIMDAGAGKGMLQWYLAHQGAEVISVDRTSRAALPLRFRSRVHVEGLRHGDLLSIQQAFLYNLRDRSIPLRQRAAGALAQAPYLPWLFVRQPGAGRVVIYNQDLATLVDLADNSLDAVVAMSALEHNTPQGLVKVVRELMRVLKPGGVLLGTLCAARDQDVWHAPSSGWCYTDASLRGLFDLPADLPSNYDRYDALFASLRDCAELRDNLAGFYFHSADNGMPCGKWDPQYQPVGVCKIKGS